MSQRYSPCPRCTKSKWASRQCSIDFRQQVLFCMECGFEVDVRVVTSARRILRRDRGQDVRAAEPVSGS